MAVPRNALKKWEKARVFAPGLPGAVDEQCAPESYRVSAPKRLTAELDAP
ncbi:hypothetical protein SUDANB51_07049 [Streptomyces sp. enrichment culture]